MTGTRKVRLKVTFEVVKVVPGDWDDDMVRFHFNKSSHCTNNLLRDRLHQTEQGDECTCFPHDVELLGPETE